jgi:glycosyltransferase involved in cell wall biosynthesis
MNSAWQASESGSPRFTIVLCTRNPRADYLARTLAGIRAQTMARDRWNLVVVDSASAPPLADREIKWPERTAIVRLDEPGVARARVAGILAAACDWIVFVDDDNVLDPDYLVQCEAVIHRHPTVALFCGRISGEFETTPPPWLGPFLHQLAIIDFPADSWATEWDPTRVPCWTAGMCVRTRVAVEYAQHLRSDGFAKDFLTRGEDVYLVMLTVARGLLAGLSRDLHMRHLIPRERMTAQYLSTITHETAYNMTVLRCRQAGAGIRDLVRAIKHAMIVTATHGFSPAGRIGRAAAWGDFTGALRCLRPRAV